MYLFHDVLNEQNSAIMEAKKLILNSSKNDL